jgi:hypothetical protein
MPFIKSLAFKRRALLIASISLNSEIMNPYSYYAKKGLMCVVLISPFKHQPSSYLECTKIKT